MAINTTTVLPAPVQTYYSELLLSTPTPNLIHLLGSEPKSLKARSGNTLRMERYERLETAPVPLGSTGITPPGQLLDSVFIDAKISFYGTYVKINEQVVATSQSPVLNQATIRLSRSMKETEDQLMRDMLATTASVIYASGGNSGDTPTEMSLSDIQSVTQTLLSNDALYISDSIEGSNKFGTAPVSAAYLGLGHTDLSSTLTNMDDFVTTIQYGSQSSVKTAEFGAVDKVRFFLSSRGSVVKNASGDGKDVYNTFICGMEAYGNVSLDGYKSEFIYHDGRFDGPLELNQTAGWKMAEVPVIKNDAWIVNLKSTLA
jgi:N4-gp56 family major capsid protein